MVVWNGFIGKYVVDAVAYFVILSQNLSGRTEENHKIPLLG
jgi:hypothetical protein